MKGWVLIEIGVGHLSPLPQQGTENGIDKTGSPFSPKFLGQFDRFIDSR